MSRDSAALAREVLEAVSARDTERLIAISDPGVEWRSFFAMGEGDGAYRGHEGTRRYMADLRDAFDIGYARADDAIAAGDVAVLVGRVRFRGKESGAETEMEAGWMMRFRDDRLVVFRAFRDPAEALAAVGLRD